MQKQKKRFQLENLIHVIVCRKISVMYGINEIEIP